MAETSTANLESVAPASNDPFTKQLQQYIYPQPLVFNMKDYPGEDPNKIQAEVTYKQIYDPKSQNLNKLGLKLCEHLNLKADSVLNRKLDFFQQ